MSPWASGDSLTPSTLNRNMSSAFSSALSGGMGLYNAKDYGSLTPDGSAAVQAAIAAASLSGGGVVFVPSQTSWLYSASAHSNDVQIFDYSGWDQSNRSLTGQVRFISKTTNPGAKNAHELHIASFWHPAIVVDVLDASGTSAGAANADLILRRNGATKWAIGMWPGPGDPGTNPDTFRIFAVDANGATISFLQSVHADGRLSFNYGFPPDDIAWTAQSSVTSQSIFRWASKRSSDTVVIQMYGGSTETRGSISGTSDNRITIQDQDLNTILTTSSSGVSLSRGNLDLGTAGVGLLLTVGSAIAPSVRYASELSLGFYRSAASIQKQSYGWLASDFISSSTTAQSASSAKIPNQGQIVFSVLSLTTNGAAIYFRSGNSVYGWPSSLAVG